MGEMSSQSRGGGNAYRRDHVDATLEDHEERITKNERRWLMTKGALMMLAIMGGSEFAWTGVLGGLI